MIKNIGKFKQVQHQPTTNRHCHSMHPSAPACAFFFPCFYCPFFIWLWVSSRLRYMLCNPKQKTKKKKKRNGENSQHTCKPQTWTNRQTTNARHATHLHTYTPADRQTDRQTSSWWTKRHTIQQNTPDDDLVSSHHAALPLSFQRCCRYSLVVLSPAVLSLHFILCGVILLL